MVLERCAACSLLQGAGAAEPAGGSVSYQLSSRSTHSHSVGLAGMGAPFKLFCRHGYRPPRLEGANGARCRMTVILFDLLLTCIESSLLNQQLDRSLYIFIESSCPSRE